MRKYLNIVVSFFIFSIYFISCKKADFLNAKPSSTIVTPNSLSDFQALLDQTNSYDGSIMSTTPALGELSTDEYYIPTYTLWQSIFRPSERNCYIWNSDIYQGEINVDDWNTPYKQIFYCNVVLDGLKDLVVDPSQQQVYNSIKGSALFIRSYAFYNLSTIFCPMFDSLSASKDLGIPLKLKSDVTENPARASVLETYNQIFGDLQIARNLLPSNINSNNRNRPCRPAVYALLARICLSIRQYNNAKSYADSSLQQYSTLIDYNTITTSSRTKFSRLNGETLYQSNFNKSSTILARIATSKTYSVDTNLYNLFHDPNDLRRKIYFTTFYPILVLNGLYSGTFDCFTGLATDECYLIRAECNARTGDVTNAMNDLNTVLVNRWKTGTFVPYSALNSNDALNQILTERRKELILRGLRWTDLRRLNKEGANIILTRTMNSQIFTLPPNSSLYILPIPPDIISLSGIQQNAR